MAAVHQKRAPTGSGTRDFSGFGGGMAAASPAPLPASAPSLPAAGSTESMVRARPSGVVRRWPRPSLAGHHDLARRQRQAAGAEPGEDQPLAPGDGAGRGGRRRRDGGRLAGLDDLRLAPRPLPHREAGDGLAAAAAAGDQHAQLDGHLVAHRVAAGRQQHLDAGRGGGLGRGGEGCRGEGEDGGEENPAHQGNRWLGPGGPSSDQP